MNEHNHTSKDLTRERIFSLHRQRAELAVLPPEQALDRILDAPHPSALVHAMPEEDFYFLVHDIGLDDAVPLISLASDTQLEYFLDMEGWCQDRIQIPVLTRWLELMMRAQPLRLVPWLVEHKTEFTEFYLFKNIQVLVREHDEDPSGFGDDFFTLDDVFYVRILPDPIPLERGRMDNGSNGVDTDDETESTVSHKEVADRRLSFIKRLLNRMADYDHVRYQQMLVRAAAILPAETEETLYRLRNVRLAEKGFLPFDEAIGIYQPIKETALRTQPDKVFGKEDAGSAPLPVPQYPLAMMGEQSSFTEALRLLDSDALLQHIQMEFAALCNQIIAADQRTIQNKDRLRAIVRKACGYLNVGLQSLTDDAPQDAKRLSSLWASFLRRYPLSQIFRFGYGRALDLKWRIQRWHRSAWFTTVGLPLNFWGEKWLGVLGGGLIKKPLFFDDYKSGELYREFMSLADIMATDHALGQIMAVDDLLSRMDVVCKPDAQRLVTYKSLLLTLWARHYLNPALAVATPRRLVPLTLGEFRTFFPSLFSIQSGDRPDEPRHIDASMKAAFLNWLSTCSGTRAETITDRLGPTLDALFDEVDSELGGVGINDLDPRYVLLFQIKA